MGKMTSTDADILRAAGVLIHHRGRQAASRAEMRAAELRSAGDLDGEATWRCILGAIRRLQGQCVIVAAPGQRGWSTGR